MKISWFFEKATSNIVMALFFAPPCRSSGGMNTTSKPAPIQDVCEAGRIEETDTLKPVAINLDDVLKPGRNEEMDTLERFVIHLDDDLEHDRNKEMDSTSKSAVAMKLDDTLAVFVVQLFVKNSETVSTDNSIVVLHDSAQYNKVELTYEIDNVSETSVRCQVHINISFLVFFKI